jgi:hypothetical protein
LAKRSLKYFLVLAMAVILQSCYNTYYMSADNLHQELNKVKDTAYAYKHKFYDAVLFTKYFNNGINEITCYDKAGKAYVIKVYKDVEAKIILKNGDSQRFLFRTMFAKDSLLYGQLAFPVNAQISIEFKDIQKIEIKDPQYAPANEN